MSGQYRRIAGVKVVEAEGTDWCKKCKREQPIVKAQTRVGTTDYVNIFCSVCEKHLTCYRIKKGEK